MIGINRRNNKLMSAGAFVSLAIGFYTLVINDSEISRFELFLFFWVFDIFYILILFYFIQILKFFKEQAAIIGAFASVGCLETINLLNELFNLKTFYTESIGILIQAASIYMIIEIFKIKDENIRTRFRLFGIAVFFLSPGRTILMFAGIRIGGELGADYQQIAIMLTLLSVYYLLKKVSKSVIASDTPAVNPA